MKKAFITGKGTRLDSIFYSLFKHVFSLEYLKGKHILIEYCEEMDMIEDTLEGLKLEAVNPKVIWCWLHQRYDQYFALKLLIDFSDSLYITGLDDYDD